MRRLNKKRIAAILILIFLLIIEILALEFSKAKNIKEIKLISSDHSKALENEEIMLKATDEGKSGFYIVLPEIINEKYVSSYLVEEKVVQTEEKIENEVTNTNIDNTIEEQEQKELINNMNINTTQNTIPEETKSKNKENKETIVGKNKLEKKPGDRIYLTKQELEQKEVTIETIYDSKKVGELNLYKKLVQQTINESVIKIEGYMPQEAKVVVEESNLEELEKTFPKEYIDEEKVVKYAYDIKIIYNEREYNPSDFDENVNVTISGVENTQEQKYKVLHIINENKVEEINEIKTKSNEIVFKTNSFSTYLVLAEEEANIGDIQMLAATNAILIEGADVWDGTTAESIKFGDGSNNNPYLITSANELAYIATQVNNGTSYENKYFHLLIDIDLNNKEWTPIGDNDNSFKGIFDGNGHVISNATIKTPESIPSSKTSYGFFGSIGGAETRYYYKKHRV